MHTASRSSLIADDSPPPASAHPGKIDCRLSPQFSSNRDVAVVQADYLALANDLEQAQALATTLETQLSGKTSELVQFKAISERTQKDLVKFAKDLDTMRQERHALANEVQCAYALELRHEKLQTAHQKLEMAHGELTARAEALDAELQRERLMHMQMHAELEELRIKASTRPMAAAVGLGRDPELKRSLEGLREHLNRVLGPPLSMVVPPAPSFLKSEHERIDIEFSA